MFVVNCAPSKPLQSSLIFESKTRAYPSAAAFKYSTQKHYTRLERAVKDKHSYFKHS